MDECHSGFRDQFLAVLLRFGVVIAPQNDFGVHRLHGIDLDLRSRARHDDDGLEPQLLSRQRDALRMIAGAGRNHAAIALGLGEFRDLVVGAAQLEAEDRLLVFALQPDVVVDASRQTRRKIERRFPRDFVDAAGQRFAQQLVQAWVC